MVLPRARYEPDTINRVVVLESTPNPTTDTYLRPRFRGPEAPATHFVDLDTNPTSTQWAFEGAGKTFVVVNRYINSQWLHFLGNCLAGLAGVAYFTDDDIPAALREPSLPLGYRLRLMSKYGQHVDALSDIASELWVSTEALARKYTDRSPRVFPPLFVPGPAISSPMVRFFYHGTAAHIREQRWLVDIVARVQRARQNTIFEVFGQSTVRQLYRDIDRVVVLQPTSWPSYLAHSASGYAQVGLAPLLPSETNASRSMIKYFDITRMGAAGIYSDVSPYANFVTKADGLLVPNHPDAWLDAILKLVDDATLSASIASAALQRCRDSMAARCPLPSPHREGENEIGSRLGREQS